MRIEDEPMFDEVLGSLNEQGITVEVVSPGVVSDDHWWRDYVQQLLGQSMVFPTSEQLGEVAVEVATQGVWNPRAFRSYPPPNRDNPFLGGIHPWWWSLPLTSRVSLAALLWPSPGGFPDLLYRVQLRFAEGKPTHTAEDVLLSAVVRGRYLARRVRKNLERFETQINRALGVPSLEEHVRGLESLWPEGPEVLDGLLREERPLVAQELLLLADVLGLQFVDPKPAHGGWEALAEEEDEDALRRWHLSKGIYEEEFMELFRSQGQEGQKAALSLPDANWERSMRIEKSSPRWVHENEISCEPPGEKKGVAASRQKKYRRLFQYLDDVPRDAVGVTLDLLNKTLAFEDADGASHTLESDAEALRRLIAELPNSASGRAFWANPQDHYPETRPDNAQVQVNSSRAHARFWLAAGFRAKPKFSAGRGAVVAVTFTRIPLRPIWHPHRHKLRAGEYVDTLRLD